MAANLPTPWQGLMERTNAFGYMLWVAVLAIMLSRDQLKQTDPIIRGTRRATVHPA